MRTVGVLVLEDSRSFDVAVAAEVWGTEHDHQRRFGIRVYTVDGNPATLRPMGAMPATHDLSDLRECDLVVVPGRQHPCLEVPEAARAALWEVHRAGVRIAALCSGAFTLAAAGLLAGRDATTHWSLLDALAVAAPEANVRGDVLFTDTGSILTSAGAAGGLDLCLHLVRCDHGAQLASELARHLVMPPVRHGGQRQYATADPPARSGQPEMTEVLDWAVHHLGQPIGVVDLAARCGMSERAFTRGFRATTGIPPGRWLRVQRIRHAQRLLETTDLAVPNVAAKSGLGTAANLRRRFADELGVGPATYRRTFAQPRL